MTNIRVAVLGAGFMGGTHARAYHQHDGVDVAAIFAKSERHALPLAQEIESEWTTDLDSILNDPSIDAIDVCLPSPQHRDIAERVIAAGKHLLLEKPISLKKEDGLALVELSKSTDQVFMVAHVLRFWPEYMKVMEVLESGQLGKPLSAVATRRQPSPAWVEQFRTAELTGGSVLDMLIHDYDIVNWVLGKPVAVTASSLRNPHSQAMDQSQVLIEYEGGGSALVDGGSLMPESYRFTMRFEILCESGAIEYNFRAGGRSFEHGEPVSTVTLFPNSGDPEVLTVDSGDAFYNEVGYFLDCVRTGSPASRAQPSAAQAALEVALAATESSESGQKIQLG